MTIRERIALARETAGKSQQDVASHFRISPQAVSQWETGASRPSQERLSELADLLDVSVSWLLTGRGEGPRPTRQNAMPADVPVLSPGDLPKDVPVYGVAVAGDAGDFSFNGERIDTARRPPGLAGRAGVFAIYVVGDSMEPWRKPGDLLYLDQHRPPSAGSHVVVECHGAAEGEPGPAYLKKLVSSTPSGLRLAQYNPPTDKILVPLKCVKRVYRVIEWSELLGV